MGCNNLKPFRALDIDNDIGDESTGLAYPKAPVDAVIAELEAERDAFEKSFNEMTEAFMKSQRALWIARALALSRFDVDDYLRKYTHCDSRYWNDGLNSFNGACKEMQKAINIAEAKCRAKAEEYK